MNEILQADARKAAPARVSVRARLSCVPMAVTCDPASFNSVKENLEKQGVKFVDATLTKLPKTLQDVDTEKGQQIMRLLENLDDHDDVQNVYTNLNVTDAMMADAGR